RAQPEQQSIRQSIPSVVISLPSLKFLDLRFSNSESSIPLSLFDKQLDDLLLNNN
ncbi:Leucine-rich repeat extensin-like protein 2, partial [Linum grandiflorum]